MKCKKHNQILSLTSPCLHVNHIIHLGISSKFLLLLISPKDMKIAVGIDKK